MSDDEKRLTAYHEAGHALAAAHCAASDPIHKATIIPRGRALGMVMRLPERDQLSMSREKMNADITVAMGGRLAEEMTFGHEKVTSGATSDIEMATKMARSMVTRFGMSDKLGPLAYAENEEEVFLGHSVSRTQNISEATAQTIDDEIRRIIDECYERCRSILSDHSDELENIAQALLEFETITGAEIDDLIAGKSLHRDDADGPSHDGGGSAVPTTGSTVKGTEGGKEAPDGPGVAPEPQPGS